MRTKTILLVEDEEESRTIYRTILRHYGYSVVEACSGEGAIQLASQQQPDLILMDLMLPGLDGWTATEQLKQDPETAHIPIVAVTVRFTEVDQARAYSAGVDGYLTKPCQPTRVLQEVQRFIGAAIEPRNPAVQRGGLGRGTCIVLPGETTVDRPRQCTLQRIDSIEASDLASDELRYAVTHLDRPSRTYRAAAVGAGGAPVTLELLHFESTGRTGISWDGAVWWLNASCVEEALELWREGEGQASIRRTKGNEEKS